MAEESPGINDQANKVFGYGACKSLYLLKWKVAVENRSLSPKWYWFWKAVAFPPL
jgi:hypothetical protein